MKFLNKIMLVVLFSFIIINNAFALKTDFESIRRYHDLEIELLLKDYTLEDSLTVRVELKRKNQELKDQDVFNIPGLYQKTGEDDGKTVENVLNLYERKFVFIKKREVQDKEIELVKQALTERLYLPKETVFTTIDNTPKLDNAVQNLKSDFLFGAYDTLIRGGQFLWILIFSIGFIVALWILAKVWKTKSAPADGGSGSGGMGNGGSNFGGSSSSENNVKADKLGFENPVAAGAFEILNFSSLCTSINECYKIAPGSTSHLLWTRFPDLKTQIQFLEIVKVQKEIPEELKEKTYQNLEGIFSYKKRAAVSRSSSSAKGISKENLESLSMELARYKFMTPNPELEKCFKEVYPANGDYLDLMFQKGYNDHYVVLYKLFDDKFMTFISSINDDRFLEKIDKLLTFDPSKDHASEEQYKAFCDFLSKENLEQTALEKQNTINPKIIKMIYAMPESEILKVEAMKSNESVRSEIPCFSWINTEDAKGLKDFFGNLSGPEIKCLLDFDPKFKKALDAMDERAQFRFNERMKTEANMALDWKQYRDKIKRFYSYKTAGSNGTEHSKAS